MVAVSHLFSAGDSIVAADLNDNFDDLEAAIGDVLSDDAGIRATQLADRYSIQPDNFPLTEPVVIFNDGATLGNVRLYRLAEGVALPANCTEIQWGAAFVGGWATLLTHQVTLDDGQEGYISEIELRVGFAADITTQFRVRKNGILVGGSAVTLSTVAPGMAFYRLRNSNPIDAPIAAIANGDSLTFEFNAVAADDAVRGASIRVVYKTRINN